jgi:hypothetical protein
VSVFPFHQFRFLFECARVCFSRAPLGAICALDFPPQPRRPGSILVETRRRSFCVSISCAVILRCCRRPGLIRGEIALGFVLPAFSRRHAVPCARSLSRRRPSSFPAHDCSSRLQFMCRSGFEQTSQASSI